MVHVPLVSEKTTDATQMTSANQGTGPVFRFPTTRKYFCLCKRTSFACARLYNWRRKSTRSGFFVVFSLRVGGGRMAFSHMIVYCTESIIVRRRTLCALVFFIQNDVLCGHHLRLDKFYEGNELEHIVGRNVYLIPQL